jgi:hypothetical protein
VKSKIVFAEHNFCIFDFYSLYKKCEPEIITNLDNYGLLNKKIAKDVKATIFHYTILEICESFLLQKGKEKNILFFNKELPNNLEITKYYSADNITRVFDGLINIIRKNLPIRILISNLTFKEVLECENGIKAEIIANVRKIVENTDFAKFTFNKVYSFTYRYHLKFLNKEYFNTIKAKQLLMT